MMGLRIFCLRILCCRILRILCCPIFHGLACAAKDCVRKIFRHLACAVKERITKDLSLSCMCMSAGEKRMLVLHPLRMFLLHPLHPSLNPLLT